MKRVLILLLCCVPIFGALAGGAKETGPATVRLGLTFDPARLKYYEDSIAQFNQKFPNIKVVLENTPWADYWNKLKTQTASNTMPDVWTYVQIFGQEWYDKNLLLPLDDFIAKAPDMNMQDFVPSAIKGMTRDGKLYALPYEGGSTIFSYVNVDLLKQAGVAMPGNDWTWDDAKAIAKQVMDKVPTVNGGKVYGFGQKMPVEDWPFATFMGSWGVQVATNDANGPAYHLDDPKAIQGLQWLFDLHYKDQLAAPIDETPKDDWTLFMNGRVPMVFTGAWQIPAFQQGAKFTFDVLPFPKGPGGRTVVSIGGYFCVSAKTKVPQAAFEVLKWITNAEQNNNIVAKPGAGVPAHLSGFQYMSPMSQKAAKIMFIDAIGVPSFAGMTGVWDTQGREFDLGMTGQKTAADVAKAIMDKAQAAIKENYGK